MDPAYVSAFVGLAGVAIGGLTSFASSWSTQRAQLREKNREIERTRRETIFVEIINEASRLYGDALSHEKDDIADLVKLYALVAHVRLVSSEAVTTAAERTMDTIIETYQAPNRTLHEMKDFAKQGGMNFLVAFTEACREELSGLTAR